MYYVYYNHNTYKYKKSQLYALEAMRTLEIVFGEMSSVFRDVFRDVISLLVFRDIFIGGR